MRRALAQQGWVILPRDPGLDPWLGAARRAATAILEDPGARATWLRHGGTWFAGVNVFPNAPDGAVDGVALSETLWRHLAAMGLDGPAWHPAQLSVVYPGYPGRDAGESDASARFRLNRDAAHVDGLLPVGPDRRRMLREPHAFVLGLPLTPGGPDRAPLTVWDQSHRVIGDALGQALVAHPSGDWPDVDLTEIYQAARRRCFETCQRRPLPVEPGEAVVLHRHLLHGIAPWRGEGDADQAGRQIVYVRPECPGGIAEWLGMPQKNTGHST